MTAQHRPTTPTALRQCAVLVGGLGTRLGALTATVPKPMLPVAGRPFLAWVLREVMRYGVTDILLLTGHLSNVVSEGLDSLRRSLPRSVTITISQEPSPAGTGGALHHARHHLHDRFLLLNGDSVLDCDLPAALAAQDGPGVLGRLMLRDVDDAARYGVVRMDGDRVAAFQERGAAGQPGTINGGIYLLDRRVVDWCSPVCSLERDVLPRLAADGALRGTAGRGWFLDIGVPGDLARAATDVPAHLRRPALFLDRDGVCNRDHGWVGTQDRFEWMPGALDAMRLAHQRGCHVFLVTNQSGVARGLYTEADVQSLHRWMLDTVLQAGGTLDDVRYCPYHPGAVVPAYRQAHPWRKPEPGMVLDLIRAWDLDPARCALVGDQPTDVQAAEAAGIPGHLFAGGNLAQTVLPILDQIAPPRLGNL